MTLLRQRMLEDIQLRGLSARTQETYLAAVQQLALQYNMFPDLLTQEQVRQYFLFLHNQRRLAPNSVNVALNAVEFPYTYTLQRPWPFRDLIRPALPQKLPLVLSVEEIWQVIEQVRRPPYRVCLSVIYSCGLRLLEGVHLQVSQIDSARMRLLIRSGKGNKDRAVPLPPRTLSLLRERWRSHRNPVWLFPSPGSAGDERATASVSMEESGVQKAFRRAREEVGLNKEATVHPYAIPGQPICSNAASTCVSSSSGWATRRPPPQFTPISPAAARGRPAAPSISSRPACHDHARRDYAALRARLSGALRRPDAKEPPGGAASDRVVCAGSA